MIPMAGRGTFDNKRAQARKLFDKGMSRNKAARSKQTYARAIELIKQGIPP